MLLCVAEQCTALVMQRSAWPHFYNLLLKHCSARQGHVELCSRRIPGFFSCRYATYDHHRIVSLAAELMSPYIVSLDSPVSISIRGVKDSVSAVTACLQT